MTETQTPTWESIARQIDMPTECYAVPSMGRWSPKIILNRHRRKVFVQAAMEATKSTAKTYEFNHRCQPLPSDISKEVERKVRNDYGVRTTYDSWLLSLVLSWLIKKFLLLIIKILLT